MPVLKKSLSHEMIRLTRRKKRGREDRCRKGYGEAIELLGGVGEYGVNK